jgi:hypothetical protein
MSTLQPTSTSHGWRTAADMPVAAGGHLFLLDVDGRLESLHTTS